MEELQMEIDSIREEASSEAHQGVVAAVCELESKVSQLQKISGRNAVEILKEIDNKFLYSILSSGVVTPKASGIARRIRIPMLF